MKRILVILLALIIAATSFVSCDQEQKTPEPTPEAHTHAVSETIEAKDATCSAEGNIKYYKCSCGKLFSDEACTTEIAQADTVIEKAAHTFDGEVGEWVRVEGTDVYLTVCTVCGEAHGEPAIVSVGMLGPASGRIFYINPNAEEDGWTYLEAVPTDSTKVTSGAMTAVTKAIGGYYVVESTNTLISGTAAEVGNGKENTDLIVAKDGSIMTASTGSTASTDYAALQCSNWKVVTKNEITYDDWFLPSTAEMKYYQVNIAETKVDNTLMKFHSDYDSNATFQSSYIGSATQVKGFCVTTTDQGENVFFKIASKNLNVLMPFIPVRRF